MVTFSTDQVDGIQVSEEDVPNLNVTDFNARVNELLFQRL
jgi:hypothetical protein